ncbi:phosphotransferase [Palleronia sp.]|uniref:phosphotransferase n=1 Tax=Palleronia sp. TaxID=1940284 RepID=UPI0035C8223E
MSDAAPPPAGPRRVRRGELLFRTTTRSEEAVAWLADVHDLAERAGFAVAHHVPGVNGRLVERGWTCEPDMPGRPFAPDELSQVRAQIKMFHDLTRRVPQRPDFRSSQALLQADESGDIDMSVLPGDIAAACRAAWQPLKGLPLSIVHGDMTARNLIWCEDGRPGLVGWDNCRRDVGMFDTADSDEAIRARLAWQVAILWTPEPERARRLAVRLIG